MADRGGQHPSGHRGTLTSATPALFAGQRNRSSDETIRGALHGWAFNTKGGRSGNPTTKTRPQRSAGFTANTVPVSMLAEPATLRALSRPPP